MQPPTTVTEARSFVEADEIAFSMPISESAIPIRVDA
jgi:hypothetical protein